jgi:hypothetical protein
VPVVTVNVADVAEVVSVEVPLVADAAAALLDAVVIEVDAAVKDDVIVPVVTALAIVADTDVAVVFTRARGAVVTVTGSVAVSVVVVETVDTVMENNVTLLEVAAAVVAVADVVIVL